MRAAEQTVARFGRTVLDGRRAETDDAYLRLRFREERSCNRRLW